MKLIAGTNNISLAKEIASLLGVSLTNRTIKRFSDGEISIKINEEVNGEDVYIFQTLYPCVNDSLMELFFLGNYLKRRGAKSITAVTPYCAYARQDNNSGEVITSPFMRDILLMAGIMEIITLDFHNPIAQRWLPIRLMNLPTTKLFSQDIQARFDDEVFIISPDQGGSQRAQELGAILNMKSFSFFKERNLQGNVSMRSVSLDFKGKKCIIIDDILDSGATLCAAVRALQEVSAEEIHAYITHAILSGDAQEEIKKAGLHSLTITNSIELSPKNNEYRTLSVAKALADEVSKRLSEIF